MKKPSDGIIVPEHLRNGHLRHVAGVLDQAPPWLLRKLIPLLSARVRIDDHVVQTIRELAANGPLVYAMKYRNIFDLHFLRLRFAELGLPTPSFVFETSSAASWSLSKFFKVWKARLAGALHEHKIVAPPDEEGLKEILENKGAGVVFLVDEKTSRNRYVNPETDPIRILLDLQGRMAASIAVVPTSILYDRRRRETMPPFWESLLGDPDNPGLLYRIVYFFRKWTVPELLIGEPVHLIAEFEEFGSEKSWDESPFQVRQELIESINARTRVNRGPEKLSRTEVKERVLQDARVQRSVREMASKEDASDQKIRKMAESYVDEIAANQSFQLHHFLYYILKWLFWKVFDGTDLRESDFVRLKKTNAQGSLIYVSSHKSHFDYLLVGFLSFINQMAIPYMAAGKNLSFWPIGPVLRNAGAFFIRRTFRGLGLYTHVFSAYLKVLVKENTNVNFYIEGGRSRTGKLISPRVGMLAFLLQTIEEGAVQDLNFVPTFIGYDQVPEEKSYLRELAGKEKEKESFWSFVRARGVLNKRFGRVYVRFHEPVSFMEFCRLAGYEIRPGVPFLRENRKLLHDFAYYLMYGIVRAGVVSPVDLTATGLVCRGLSRISHDSLVTAVDHLSAVSQHGGFEFVETAVNPDVAVRNAMGMFISRGFVAEEDALHSGGNLFRIVDARRGNLDFYRNGLVNYVWPASLLAMIILSRGPEATFDVKELSEEFGLLRSILSKELTCDPLASNEETLSKTLEFFEQKGWIRPTTESGPSRIEAWPLECLAGTLWDLVEIYYLALVAAEGANGVSQKDLTKKMLATAMELRREGTPRLMPVFPAVPVN
ncbi:MAG: 1-acyl-sn-glycerol-3-phosphate acyltransferase, partial [Desulfomonile tiedjei]|nr:1-acyl-sn-glycerol-3-phosphate acyltransferase [Desulfomonile tiedjei]